MAKSAQSHPGDGGQRFPWPRSLWRVVARFGGLLASPAVGRGVEDPREEIRRVSGAAVEAARWDVAQPPPVSVALDLELPAEPAYDTLQPQYVHDAAREAALEALVRRFGRGSDRCGVVVTQRRGALGLRKPLAQLRLEAGPRRRPLIRRMVIGIAYVDSRRYPWQEVTRTSVDGITIGTDPGNDVRIPEEAAQGVSKFHCWARCEQGKLMVRDGRVIEDDSDPGGPVVLRPESTNGTAVDGQLLPNPRSAVEWRKGTKLVLAPLKQTPDRPMNTPQGRGATLWLLDLELNEESLDEVA